MSDELFFPEKYEPAYWSGLFADPWKKGKPPVYRLSNLVSCLQPLEKMTPGEFAEQLNAIKHANNFFGNLGDADSVLLELANTASGGYNNRFAAQAPQAQAAAVAIARVLKQEALDWIRDTMWSDITGPRREWLEAVYAQAKTPRVTTETIAPVVAKLQELEGSVAMHGEKTVIPDT